MRETLVTAMRFGIQSLAGSDVAPLAAAFANADSLFDHVLTFEDNPHDDEPIDAEELDVGAQDVDVETAAAAAHLRAATSLEDLESRARRAAKRRRSAKRKVKSKGGS